MDNYIQCLLGDFKCDEQASEIRFYKHGKC